MKVNKSQYLWIELEKWSDVTVVIARRLSDSRSIKSIDVLVEKEDFFFFFTRKEKK